MLTGLKRLVGVQLVVSCAVINDKLGPDPLIGSGLTDLYFNIKATSFPPPNALQPFSFKGVFKVVDSYLERQDVLVSEALCLWKKKMTIK